ncbi:MAG: 30S ribosomal protein S15 [Planctomycetes bacterium]|nr:30S ribosomal protein S15 [Planctomycetota bacterium]MCP4838309.1 30S ribosomal protein S15 [Planctomycetota bacterium]
MALTLNQKTEIIGDYRRDDADTGSPEVQVALLTSRIQEINEHLQSNKKDHAARLGLVKLVGKRNRLLQYLSRINPAAYRELIKRLGLRK